MGSQVFQILINIKIILTNNKIIGNHEKILNRIT